MAKTTRQTAFDGLHPAFAACYFGAVLVLTMACVHPVMIALSVFAGIVYNMRLRGVRATGQTLLWQMPLLIIITVANPVFSMFGSTVLLRAGTWCLYGESLAYGACMGGLLVSTFLWFSNAAQVLTSDKISVLMGGRAPVLGLVLTMTMRLVPQFVRRGKDIGQVQQACTAAGAGTGVGARAARNRAAGRRDGQGLATRVRQVTVLMGWGMEDSLETADAMRARGWGASSVRTTYSRCQFGGCDALACGLLLALVATCVACAVVTCGSFSFYPALGPWAPAWWYFPQVVLLCLPAMMEVLH